MCLAGEGGVRGVGAGRMGEMSMYPVGVPRPGVGERLCRGAMDVYVNRIVEWCKISLCRNELLIVGKRDRATE